MARDIWGDLNGNKYIQLVHETAWRIVEAQESVATRNLVDTYEEQLTLEEMIDADKPSMPPEFLSYHPLLSTPFRYPPLKHGSRFGKKFESGMWYGSLERHTAMAEKAFYQLIFLQASQADYGIIQVPLTVFSAVVKTQHGIHLNQAPFTQYAPQISSKENYSASQSLGLSMRRAGIEAFTYISARDINEGNNIALFTPKAFHQKKPTAHSFESWQCTVCQGNVEFTKLSALNRESVQFTKQQFMVDGALPFPAS